MKTLQLTVNTLCVYPCTCASDAHMFAKFERLSQICSVIPSCACGGVPLLRNTGHRDLSS